MENGLALAGLIVVASFAIDRITAATFFLLSFSRSWNGWFPEARFLGGDLEKTAAERKLKLVYYAFTGVLALALTIAWDMRILSQLRIPAYPGSTLDHLFTAIVLMGGSGQIAALLPGSQPTKPPAPAAEPLKLTGSITLHDAAPEAPRRRE